MTRMWMLHSLKLTNRHGKSTILMGIYQEVHGIFMGELLVSGRLRESHWKQKPSFSPWQPFLEVGGHSQHIRQVPKPGKLVGTRWPCHGSLNLILTNFNNLSVVLEEMNNHQEIC